MALLVLAGLPPSVQVVGAWPSTFDGDLEPLGIGLGADSTGAEASPMERWPGWRAIGASHPSDADPDLPEIPLPAELAPRVGFWVRVIARYGVRDVILHDSTRPERILTVLTLPVGIEPRTTAARRWAADLVTYHRKLFREAATALERGEPSALPAHLRSFLEEGVSDPGEADASAAAPSSGTDPRARVLAAEAGRLARDLRSQSGLREAFAESLSRSGRYLEMIRAIFREQGIPLEIAFLPHLESGFNPLAESRVGARGLWQFTRGTGAQFMRIDAAIDERLDPRRATEAAARYLRGARDALGSWPLAITSYNYGVHGMKRAVANHGVDLVAILENHDGAAMGFAVRNFYAEFLAVVKVMREPGVWFADTELEPPEPLFAFEAPAYLDAAAVVSHFGTDLKTLDRLNPALSRRVWAGELRIPKGSLVRVPVADPVLGGLLAASLPAECRHDRQQTPCYHRIRPGETLSTIAAQHRITVSRLITLNGLRTPDRILAGQRLELPCANP